MIYDTVSYVIYDILHMGYIIYLMWQHYIIYFVIRCMIL